MCTQLACLMHEETLSVFLWQAKVNDFYPSQHNTHSQNNCIEEAFASMIKWKFKKAWKESFFCGAFKRNEAIQIVIDEKQH